MYNPNMRTGYEQRPTYQQNQGQQTQQPFSQQQTMHQSMQIKNPQTGQSSQQKGTGMNDRDRLNDMLSTEKHLADSYNVFASEASYSQLHQDVLRILSGTHQEARGLFNYMFNQGWYSLQAESTQQVAQVQQKFANCQDQFAQPSNVQQGKFESQSQTYQPQMF